MKFVLIALLTFGTTAWANSSDTVLGACEDEAETYIENFEETLIEMEGVAQGDIPFLDFEKKTVNSAEELFQISSNHENEDGETWAFIYRIGFETYELEGAGVQCALKSFSFVVNE